MGQSMLLERVGPEDPVPLPPPPFTICAPPPCLPSKLDLHPPGARRPAVLRREGNDVISPLALSGQLSFGLEPPTIPN